MKYFALVAFLAALANANAGIIPPAAAVLEGPSSRTTIVGPEGSVISSVAPGGKIITESLPGVAAYSAPAILPSYDAPAGPAIAPAIVPTSVVAARAPLGYTIPSIPAYGAPIVPAQGSVNAIISGPSGTVAASRGLTAADLVSPIW